LKSIVLISKYWKSLVAISMRYLSAKCIMFHWMFSLYLLKMYFLLSPLPSPLWPVLWRLGACLFVEVCNHSIDGVNHSLVVDVLGMREVPIILGPVQ
jgi:hypothetical protein